MKVMNVDDNEPVAMGYENSSDDGSTGSSLAVFYNAKLAEETEF